MCYDVFPAQAGMILSYAEVKHSPCRIPRAGGDDPCTIVFDSRCKRYSPRKWG